jgi:hypothetical protein
MSLAIGYLRVSTKEQGRSGLGLAAQHYDINALAAREGFTVQCWYHDIQTGAGKHALCLRPGLASALKAAKAAHCPPLVARLDRLSRKVLHFIAALRERRVHFIVAAFGRGFPIEWPTCRKPCCKRASMLTGSNIRSGPLSNSSQNSSLNTRLVSYAGPRR